MCPTDGEICAKGCGSLACSRIKNFKKWHEHRAGGGMTVIKGLVGAVARIFS